MLLTMQINPNPIGAAASLIQAFQSGPRPEAKPAEQAPVGRTETETAVQASERQEQVPQGAAEGPDFPRGSFVDLRA